MPFSIGDKVEWSSQSMGTHKKKVGRVIAVIGKGERPDLYKKAFVDAGTDARIWPGSLGLPRQVDSYFIQVDAPEGSKAKARVYWPVSSLLKKAKA